MATTVKHPDLGSLVAVYPPNYIYAARRLLGGMLSVAAGIAFTLIGLRVIPFPVKEEFWETVAVYATGGVFLAFGLFFATEAVLTTGPRVLVFERGFVAGRRAFSWDRIDAFYQLAVVLSFSGLPLSLTEYTVRADDGRIFRFTHGVRRAAILAALIQERINPRLLAEARAAFAAGEEVDFGEASIDADGLRFCEVTNGQWRTVRWNDLRAVEADGMQIRVRKATESRLSRLAGAGDNIATIKVANVGVFLALVNDILSDRAASQEFGRGSDAGRML